MRERSPSRSRLSKRLGTTRGKGKDSQGHPHAVDFVGRGTFQVSELNLLLPRSVESLADPSANLSARGLHHRTRDHFTKTERSMTAILNQAKRDGGYDKSLKASAQIVSSYFQRALAHEKLGKTAQAIADYNVCVSLQKNHHQAYFNRSGLMFSRGDLEAATKDCSKAVDLDPANQLYRTNLALLLRRQRKFAEAIKQTMIFRAIEGNPEFLREIQVK